MGIKTEYRGAKLPMFVPCLGGRCPEQMQLEGYREYGETSDDSKMVYRCMRKRGYVGQRNNEEYTGDCYYHEHPYPARDYSYWHRSPDSKAQHKHTDDRTADEWGTVI